MQAYSHSAESPPNDSGLVVSVAGPERELPSADIRRLFDGERVTRARRERMLRHPRVVVTCDTTIVGLAVYERVASELRVHEFAIDHQSPCSRDAVAVTLLKALDLAGVAGGDLRIVLTPRAGAFRPALRECGYAGYDEGCAGRWLQKTLREMRVP